MIYQNPKTIIEMDIESNTNTNIELLLEFNMNVHNFKVHFFSNGDNNIDPEHGPRFKFCVNSSTPNVDVVMNGATNAILVYKCKFKHVPSEMVQTILDISFAMGMFMGNEISNFYYARIPNAENELKVKIAQFNNLPKSEFNKYKKAGAGIAKYSK